MTSEGRRHGSSELSFISTARAPLANASCFLALDSSPSSSRGIWKNLEEKVRVWTINRGEVYIYTGPIYTGTPKVIGKNEVAVPSHLYKIVYDPIQVEAIAFIMPNQKLNTADMPTYIVPIRDIEEKTGLNFLSKLRKRVQDSVETEKAVGLWNDE